MLLHLEFVKAVRRWRSKPAFIDRTTQKRVSYSQALMGALILARRFRRYDDRYLGILLPTSAGCGLAVVAALMSGKIPVMVNYSTGAAANCRYARDKCGFETMITSRAFLEKIDCSEIAGMVYLEDILESITPWQKLSAAVKSRLPVALLSAVSLHRGDANDTAVILFTSGSEKEPKAVQLSHRNICSNMQASAEAFGCSEKDKMLAILPLFHVFGLTTTFWLPLCRGMTIVTYSNPLEFKTVARIIREEQPTIVVGTPYFLAGYLKQSSPGDFECLRLAVVGADKMPEWLHEAYLKQHNVEVYEGYGATETSPVISANTPAANRLGSIGQPLTGTRVKIVDLETGTPLAANEEGKILVKGDQVMKGYLGDLEETALRIENGWYETGDMGVLDEDGFLWHRGRLKRFIKIGGEMVSLVQVESELEKLLHDGVECCAVELPDKKRGASVGVAVTREIDQKAIFGALAKRLPPLAMPKQIFVIDELPKMGSGKIDFRKTTEMTHALLNR